MRTYWYLVVAMMAAGVVSGTAPLGAQRLAEQRVALSSRESDSHSTLDSFWVRSNSVNRSNTVDRFPPRDPAPLMRSNHVLVGGLLGAIAGAGSAAIYLARNCDDCFYGPQVVGLAGVSGAIIGGIIGSSVFDAKRARRQRGPEQQAK